MLYIFVSFSGHLSLLPGSYQWRVCWRWRAGQSMALAGGVACLHAGLAGAAVAHYAAGLCRHATSGRSPARHSWLAASVGASWRADCSCPFGYGLFQPVRPLRLLRQCKCMWFGNCCDL